MGQHAQRRLIRKLDLELFLSKVPANASPKISFEQYTITESAASTALYIAYVNQDLVGKSVLDLGCGTGRLALGAAYVGAKNVTGIDIDKSVVSTAFGTAIKSGLSTSTDWIIGDINAVYGSFDTVLQNPPFGVQKLHADRDFLVKALQLGKSIYSFHNHPVVDKNLIKRLKAGHDPLVVEPSPFLKRFIEQHNGVVKVVYALLMTIPRMYDFHTKEKHDFVIDLYLIGKA
jgi:putative methylase